jgi:hypothetical protein
VGINGIRAMNVQQERWRDMNYSPDVLASPEYQAGLLQAYGPARVALVQQALAGNPAPISDYAEAMYGSDTPSKKRDAGTAGTIGSMAATFDAMQSRVTTDLVPAIMDRMNERMASLPPPLRTVGSGLTGANTATTDAQLAAEAVAFDNSESMATGASVISGRLINSAWGVVRAVYVSSNAPTSSKRAVAAEKRDATSPSIISLVTRGLKGLLNVTHEMYTGLARANATATTPGSVVTTVQWSLNAAPLPRPNPIYAAAEALRIQSGFSTSSLPRPPPPPPSKWERFLGTAIINMWAAKMQVRAAPSLLCDTER